MTYIEIMSAIGFLGLQVTETRLKSIKKKRWLIRGMMGRGVWLTQRTEQRQE